MIHVAKRLNLSDKGLAKACRSLNVPIPSLGYWAKLQFGKKVEKPVLPVWEKGTRKTYEFDLSERRSENPFEKEPILEEYLRVWDKPEHRINVSDELKRLHPVVKTTYEALKGQKGSSYYYGFISSWQGGQISVRITPDSVQRAIKILDALMKSVEIRGFGVTAGGDRSENREFGSSLLIDGINVHFKLTERVKQSVHILTDVEKREQKMHSWSSAPKYDYHSTGMLALEITEWTRQGIQKRWADTNHKKLEHLLDDFILGAVRTVAAKRYDKKCDDEETARQEEIRKRKLAEEQKRQAEIERIRDLELQAEQWNKSQMLKNYITEVEKRVAGKGEDKNPQENASVWLKWAKGHMERLDPLSKGLPFDN
jgi:hypothetical protein